MSVLPCCALEFPFFYCDLPSTKAPKESCAVHWDFHFWKHFMWFTLKSTNPKIARFIFFYALLHSSIHHSVIDLDAVYPCVIPGKGPKPRAGRAVFPAAKQCRPTIRPIPWSSAESTSRPQVNLANGAVHTQAQWARAATCVLCKVLFFSLCFVFFKINYGVVSFSAYRVSVYRGYRRLSS